MKTLTDHDLLQVVDKWAKDLPNEKIIGIRTAFATGFRYAEKLYLPDAISNSFCNLYKKKCMGIFCSVTPYPEKCEHLNQAVL